MLDRRAISTAETLVQAYYRLSGLPHHFHIVTEQW